LGWDFESISQNLLAGKSAVREILGFDVANHPSKIGAGITDVPVPPGFSEVAFRSRSRLEQLCLFCVQASLQDAGLWQKKDQLRIGLIIGNASDCMWHWEEDGLTFMKEEYCLAKRDRPPLVSIIQKELGIQGPATVLSAACASANFAFDMARQWLDLGLADVCLAGGCDTGLTAVTLACFGNLRALSRNNENPAGASRPFDRGRDGFVLGEGGVMFVLEKENRAKSRSAPIYGNVLGCGLTSDAHHMVIPNPEPTQAARAIRMALEEAGLNPDQVDYVNAHGTSTPVGDAAEAKAIQMVFEEITRIVPVSSTKSMTGHLLTAASALEALACLTAFRYSAIPPTINLQDIDPDCQLNHVANHVQERKVKVALSNSFGFGGSNSCLVLAAA
jgi:3-oxoacyl-[acyl-carrier-protein] synthase II